VEDTKHLLNSTTIKSANVVVAIQWSIDMDDNNKPDSNTDLGTILIVLWLIGALATPLGWLFGG